MSKATIPRTPTEKKSLTLKDSQKMSKQSVARTPTDLTLVKKGSPFDIDIPLSRMEAAVWLLDQIKVGELYFLDDKKTKLPTWISSGLELEPGDVRDWLEQFALEAIVTSLKEIRKE